MLLASVYCKRFGKIVAAVWVGVDVKRTTLGYLCPSVLCFKFDVEFSILTESYSFRFAFHSFNSFNSCSIKREATDLAASLDFSGLWSFYP